VPTYQCGCVDAWGSVLDATGRVVETGGKDLWDGIAGRTFMGAFSAALAGFAGAALGGGIAAAVIRGLLWGAAIGLMGSFFGALTWNYFLYRIDPLNVVHPFGEWGVDLSVSIIVIIALVAAPYFSIWRWAESSLWARFLMALCSSVAFGMVVGTAAGMMLIDTQFGPVLFALTGLAIGGMAGLASSE
jgi:hypothetical protein